MNPVPPRDELRAYRDRTIALLRRYFMLSIETGRLPSLLGREFFRAKCSSYRLVTFEDAVIFVQDIEKCLRELDPFSKAVIARVILHGCTLDEAARLLRKGRMTVIRYCDAALDNLSEIFLRKGLLRILPQHEEELVKPPRSAKSRQVIARVG
jgi:hypothetical protein